MPRAVDLTGAYAMKRFHKEPKKRLGLWGTLIVSNLVWLAVLLVLSSTILGLSKVVKTMTDSYLHERSELSQVRDLSAKELAERDMKIARLIKYQSSSPADVVDLGRKISTVLDTVHSRYRLFFERALPEAMHLQVTESIPASAMLAMSIYESGYGHSVLATQHNNFFGIKAFSDWRGLRANSMSTRDSGVLTTADFRAYKDIKEGFKGYVDFLKENERYAPAFKKKSGPEFVQAILKAGYCPDQNYHANIMRIMERHHLVELDEMLETATGTSVLASNQPAKILPNE